MEKDSQNIIYIKEMIKISVIIPTYNRSKTIEYCLKSVLNQTFPAFEVIVVDDCSTDNTIEIVKNYPDERIKCFILTQNSGAQVARNRGIKEAKGEWIAFQDSDDEWLPEKLEKQVKELEKLNFDPFTVIHGSCFVFNLNENKKTVWNLPIIEGKKNNLKILTTSSPMFQAMLISKKALEKINYLDDKVPSYQEWDTSILLSKYCQFVHIKEPLFIYYLHGDETISKNKFRDILGYQYIINKHKQEIITNCGEKTYNNHLQKQTQKCISWDLTHQIFKSENTVFVDLQNYITDNFIKNFGYKEKFSNLKKSNSFRLGSFLLSPLRKIKSIIK